MESMIAVIILAVLGVPIALAIWLIVRAVQAKGRIEELSFRLSELETDVIRLKHERESAQPAASAPKPVTLPPLKTAAPTPSFAPPPPPVPGPKPALTLPSRAQILQRQREGLAAPPVITSATPPAQPPLPPIEPEPAPQPRRPAAPAINWEQFMGVKGFAWVGGLAFFLGVAFFVKYSFDNNLISPELRMAFGFLTGLGLLVGGVVASRKQYAVGAQTLCATGVVILYAVTFACRSIYHFEFFGALPTFLLMALITTTAFLLAVRLNALVVAILGMLGGFLTPICSPPGRTIRSACSVTSPFSMPG